MATKLGVILADFNTSLASDIAIGGTTATLSIATDDDSVALPSGRYFFTLDGGNSSKEHISCDLVGTALTNIKSVSRQGVETTGAVRKHRIGSTVTITDFAHIKYINDLLSGLTSLNASAPLGYDGAPAGLAGNQLATVAYVLSVVNGGTVAFDNQIITGVAGETLVVNDFVYFKESDQRWWKVDADTSTTFNGLMTGFAKGAASAGGGTTIQISGVVSGLSGLTAGAKYYASNTAGAISSTAGTIAALIGWALSTTTLLLQPYVSPNEKLALAGSQGIPNSSNKYLTQDNTFAFGYDQSQTSENADIEFGEADTTGKKSK